MTDVVANNKNNLSTENFNSARFIEAKMFRGPHLLPLKKQINCRYHRIFSIKAGMREVCVAGDLIADAIIKAEAEPSITKLCERPLRIEAPLRNKPHYTFDLSFTFKSKQEVFYEVLNEASLRKDNSGTTRPKDWNLIERWGSENGYRCEFITNKNLEKDKILIFNWRELLSHARNAYKSPDPLLEREVLELCKNYKEITLEKIINLCASESQHIIACLAKHLHKGVLSSDLDTYPLTIKTIIKSSSHDQETMS